MRQAVIHFDNTVIGEWGLETFHEAGVLDAEVLSCEGSRGVIRLHVAEEPAPHRLNDTAVIEWWEQVSDEEQGYMYLVEVDSNDVVSEVDSDGERHSLAEDVDVTGDGITVTLSGSQDRISNEVAAMKAAGIDVTVKQVRGYRITETPIDSLTDRQQELLELAFDLGYYDVLEARRRTNSLVQSNLTIPRSRSTLGGLSGTSFHRSSVTPRRS